MRSVASITAADMVVDLVICVEQVWYGGMVVRWTSKEARKSVAGGCGCGRLSSLSNKKMLFDEGCRGLITDDRQTPGATATAHTTARALRRKNNEASRGFCSTGIANVWLDPISALTECPAPALVLACPHFV